jgi:hypothetical protein
VVTVTDPDRLAEIATTLAVLVRDDTPEANGAWLAAQLPDPADWWALIFVLAAAVPDDRPWTALTAWARHRDALAPTKPEETVDEGEVLRPARASQPARRKTPDELQPCGTEAAAARHRYYGEDLCEACRLHERIRNRIRKAEARGRADAARRAAA